MVGWIIFFAFVELYSIGMCVLLKKLGVKCWPLCLLPLAVFFYAEKIAGYFKILMFPVKNWIRKVIGMCILTFLAYLFGVWAIGHQNPQNVPYLLDILWLIAVTCIGVVWLGIAASTDVILSKLNKSNRLLTFACYLLIPVPFLLAFRKINFAQAASHGIVYRPIPDGADSESGS